MTDQALEIKSRLAMLPKQDQLELAQFLLEQLREEPDSAWGEAWRLELRRRDEEVENGQACFEPVEQVMAELRKNRHAG